jgi:hypothetical protein
MVPASSSVTGIFKYTYKIPVYDFPLQLVKIKAQFRQISFTKTSRRDTQSQKSVISIGTVSTIYRKYAYPFGQVTRSIKSSALL